MGECGVRENLGGVLYAHGYEELARLEREPVERIPLYHWRPGSIVLSVGSIGESFPPELAPPSWPRAAPEAQTRFAALHELIDMAAGAGIGAIACLGGEPFIGFEQLLELAERARADGRATVVATNAYTSEAPARAVAPLLDAANVLLLGPARVYERRAGARIEPVLRTIDFFRQAGVHLEATFLVLSGANDDAASLDEVARLVAGPLGGCPLHVTGSLRAEDAAPVKTMLEIAEELRRQLPHVYLSHVYSFEANNTYCRACSALLVDRVGARVAWPGLAADGMCLKCGADNHFRILPGGSGGTPQNAGENVR
jgi:pyruvate formate lyase activating enzyme